MVLDWDSHQGPCSLVWGSANVFICSLVMKTHLSVILFLVSGLTSGRAEVSFVAVSKTQGFAQFSPHIALLDREEEGQDDPLSFEVFVQGSEEGGITAGTVVGGGNSVALSPDGDSWYFSQQFESKEDFDAAFPSGVSYEVTVETALDESNSFSLAFSSDSYPNVPFITNWANLQEADSSGTITIEWESFVGGTVDDHISVGIEREGPGGGGVYDSPVPGEPGALDGTSDSLSLPGGTLEPGRRYTVNVSFYRIVGTAGGEVGSAAAFGKQNRFPLITETDSDTRAPQLRYSNPENGRSSVPDDAIIMFQFDEPMDTSVNLEAAVQWEGGITPSDVSYLWSDEGERLFCVIDGGLPLGATFGWELNPEGEDGIPGLELADLAGNRLFARSGSFTTADTSNGFSGAAEWYYLIRARYFRQIEGTVSPLEDFRTYAGVGMSSYNSLSYIAAVIGGDVVEIDGDRRGDRVEGSANYFEASDQENFFPASGSYGFRFRPVGSPVETSVELAPPSGVFPAAPVVSNHLEAQAVDASSDFTLTWEPVLGAGPDDFYIIAIDNQYDRSLLFTPFPGQSGPVIAETIPASSTSLVIPADTLPPGRNLELSIAYVAVDGRNVDPQFGTGTSGVASLTALGLVTLGDPIAPELTELSGDSSSFQFVVTGERGVPYTVECSTDGENWTPVMSQSADGSDSDGAAGSFTFSTATDSDIKLFRVVEGNLLGDDD